MVTDEELKKFLEAARVTSSLREFIPEIVKPGKTFLEVVEAIEKEIYSAGAFPAFPVNVSLNDIAAHYTPKINDASVFTEKDVAKIDFGVHVDGFIIDNAITLDLSDQHAALVEAAEQALENALAIIKPGVSNKEVGAIVQETIVKKGFKPIENLCGHSIEQYALHAGVEVPNVPKGNYVFQEGDVFAIEPFATTGSGRITDGSYCEIYAVLVPKNVRHPTTRAVLEYVLEHYQTLPFAKRWLAKQFSETSIDIALADLQRQGIIESFPVLKEINGGVVSQAEATIIIEKDGVKVLG